LLSRGAFAFKGGPPQLSFIVQRKSANLGRSPVSIQFDLPRYAMALSPSSQVRDFHRLTADQKARIRDFLQGAFYCWCKNRPNEWFSLRDLMGGANTLWGGTPLFPLYQKYHPVADAVERAGQDGGWLLKKVIADDARTFETREAELIRQYRWIQNPTACAEEAESSAAADPPRD
jgi:hypothetical protein